MTIQECYNAFGGDYEDVKARLQSDNLLSRLLTKFLDDATYVNLSNAIAEDNYAEAFREAHTLKGICQNLSFARLSKSSGDLTELLRKWETVPVDKKQCDRLFLQVTVDYKAVIEAIKSM